MVRSLLGTAILILAALSSGCATPHFTEMLMYDCGREWRTCELPRDQFSMFQANNPIYVREGAKVSLEMVQINPGWIHQDRKVGAPNEGGDARELNRKQSEHISGKELWIVTRIVALTANSPLELEGKTYFKVSNLKFGSESFRSLPLDLSEIRTFTHTATADTSYRILLRVFEVDGFEIKRALLKTYRDNPGIAGIFTSLWDTLVSTIGSLAGDAVVSSAKSLLRVETLDDPLVVESLLLEGGASLELEGTLHLFTKVNDKSQEERKQGWITTENYLLYDKWKSLAGAESGKWDYSFSDRKEYLAAQAGTEAPFDMSTLTKTMSFMRLTVTQSEAPPNQQPNPGANDPIQRHQALPSD